VVGYGHHVTFLAQLGDLADSLDTAVPFDEDIHIRVGFFIGRLHVLEGHHEAAGAEYLDFDRLRRPAGGDTPGQA
jgi:hypothetical protein